MTQVQKLMTWDRSGEFKVFTHGDSHCGTMSDQVLPIKYRLLCVCENKLDERGFLFDQINVERFFQRIRRTTLSCERLTISCANRLVKVIRRDNPHCRVRSLDLTLTPFPYVASMTYSVANMRG